MNETSHPARNRLATAGFVINCLGICAFLAIFLGGIVETGQSASEATASSATETSFFAEGLSDGLSNATQESAPAILAVLAGGLIWGVGSLCCLIALIWRPRLMAVSGLLLVAIFLAGFAIYN